MSDLPFFRAPLMSYPVRLLPGMELKSTLLSFVSRNNLKSPFIMTCCGSVSKATLRFAENPPHDKEIRTFDEHFEICSLVGTLSTDSGCHLHVVLGRKDGTSVAGHVVGDMVIFTTAEVVLGECEGLRFDRKTDEDTGYPELVVSGSRDT